MIQKIRHQVQLCVIGGGLAGVCTAISAARHGVKTLLMQERPVYGGNASSEIRMWVCGAKGCMETGLIEEIRLENLYRNPNSCYSIWDSVLFGKVQFQKNLTGLLNCSCIQADTFNRHIRSITGWQQTTHTYHIVEADYFADCSGDSILAQLAGAEYRRGREASSEFEETLAPETSDTKTMGMSCILQAREMSSPQAFTPPEWAYDYPSDSAFPNRWHDLEDQQNFWWLELGGDKDSICDTESVRDELLRTAFGIWDHIKNHGNHGAENWALDWVGFLPGKRESLRCTGDYILTQNDVMSAGKFPDIVAYGGWPIDDHHPAGFLHHGAPNRYLKPPEPYGIPLRCLYSKNIDNLYFAGRNISCSHVGLSSTRVMATCATLGQAVGTAVWHAVKNGGLSPRETANKYIKDIQNTLMDDDAYLPGLQRKIPEISQNAELFVSRGNPDLLRNGIERDLSNMKNRWDCVEKDFIHYEFDSPSDITSARIVFDSDLERDFPWNMMCNYPLDAPLFHTPETLVKAFHLTANGKEIFRCKNNYQRLVTVPLNIKNVHDVELHIDAVRGNNCGIFAFDLNGVQTTSF